MGYFKKDYNELAELGYGFNYNVTDVSDFIDSQDMVLEILKIFHQHITIILNITFL